MTLALDVPARRQLFLILALAALAARTGAATNALAPRLVSPTAEAREARVDTQCPTFSWTASPEARGYELVVYEVSEPRGGRKPSEDPVVRHRLPAGASSWTPSLGSCLAPGRYGWAVGAVVESTAQGEVIRWSQAALLRVEPPGNLGQAPRPRSVSSGGRLLAAAGAPASVSASPAGLRNAPGETYGPPNCASGGEMFTDVPASDPFCRWIELVARAGIAGSCNGAGGYCPDNPVTRKQMAMALGRVMYGSDHWVPPQGVNPLAPPADNVITTVDGAGTVGAFASITIGADGLPVISYIDGSNGDLRVAHCNDVACAGQDETLTTVDATHSVNFYTSITIGGDGLPIISYYDTNNGNLKVAHCNDVACAGQDESVTTVDNASEAVGFTSAIAIGRDGLPIVSYQEDNPLGNASFRVAHCNDPACAGQNETITEVESFLILTSHGSYSSIAISPDGFPSASYVRGTGDLSFMRCNDPLCAGSNESMQLVDPAVPCSSTSLTFGVDGLPIISYHDGNAGTRDLKVAHCTDLACLGKNITVVHSTGIVGEYTSIAIGADGLPIISYFDQSAGVLRVAHCNDPACSGNATLVVVDDPVSGNTVGLFTSIAIGADGLPIIAYFDQTAEALKVAHCANVYCAPYFRRR